MVWECYCNASPKPEFFFIFFVYICIHISANMSPFGLKFSHMILHTETSKLMYNWSFLFEVLHKPTLLLSTFNSYVASTYTIMKIHTMHLHEFGLVVNAPRIEELWTRSTNIDTKSWYQQAIRIFFRTYYNLILQYQSCLDYPSSMSCDLCRYKLKMQVNTVKTKLLHKTGNYSKNYCSTC